MGNSSSKEKKMRRASTSSGSAGGAGPAGAAGPMGDDALSPVMSHRTAGSEVGDGSARAGNGGALALGDGQAGQGGAVGGGGGSAAVDLTPSRSRQSTQSGAGGAGSALSRTPTNHHTQQQQHPPSLTPSSSAAEIPTSTILSNPLPVSSSVGTATPSSSTLSPSSVPGGPPSGLLSTSPTSAIASALPARPQGFDIDDMISRLLDAGYSGKVTKSVCLKNAEITQICAAAREVFLSQPTLIELSPPVKIVGDVHGQYSDLIRLFEMCGFPPQANYLFLGDYVDRGKQSLETILLLLCYKVKYPENFFLLRGNHECANVTRVYGFYDECKRRCNIKIWKTMVDVFNCLPIAAVVASKIFCVHGGLSPSLNSMEDIRRISRPTDVPDYGLLNDLLWSDPSDTALDWEDNERGVSYCFGRQVLSQFLSRHDLDLITRAHMVVEDGYEFWHDRSLVTIFSAPNYCGEFDNFGAVMSVSEDLLCAFELLKPLDAQSLKRELAKTRRRLSSSASGAGA
ncbi:hypothetical protein JCM10213_005362 [Rhodosporidiobolus nylandii]